MLFTIDDSIHGQMLHDDPVSTVPLPRTEHVQCLEVVPLLVTSPLALPTVHPLLRHVELLHHKQFLWGQLLPRTAVPGKSVLQGRGGEVRVLQVEQDKDGPRPLATALQLAGKAGEEL